MTWLLPRLLMGPRWPRCCGFVIGVGWSARRRQGIDSSRSRCSVLSRVSCLMLLDRCGTWPSAAELAARQPVGERAARHRPVGRRSATASSAQCATETAPSMRRRAGAGAVPVGHRGLAQWRADAGPRRSRSSGATASLPITSGLIRSATCASASQTSCAAPAFVAYLQAGSLRRAPGAGQQPRPWARLSIIVREYGEGHAPGAVAGHHRAHALPRACGATLSPTFRTRSARR